MFNSLLIFMNVHRVLYFVNFEMWDFLLFFFMVPAGPFWAIQISRVTVKKFSSRNTDLLVASLSEFAKEKTQRNGVCCY